MIITPLINKLREALITDSELQLWGQLNFSRSVRVDIGMDSRGAPDPSTYPLLVLAGRRPQLASGRTRVAHEIDLLCFIESADVAEDAAGRVQAGFLLVGELRELATRALVVGAGARIAALEERESEMRAEPPIFVEAFCVLVESQIHPIRWEIV